MADEHVRDLAEANPNPTLEEEADALDAVAVAPEATPAIPDKFIRDGKPDYEALAKAYAELEKKQAQSGKKDDTTTPEEEKALEAASPPTDTTPPAGDEAAAVAAAKSAGLDYNALSSEYAESGKLADSSYAALERSGIPRNIIDGYIAGQEAIVTETKNSVFREVGGEETYDNMTSWAAENLSEPEITAYDKAVNSGDMNQITLAVKGLQARFNASEGSEPTVQLGGSATSDGSNFKSWAQVTKAMNDKRYGVDPAYMAEVESKLGRSPNLT